MTGNSSYRLLSAHHVPYEVLALVERARSYVVLATAYFDMWAHLDVVLRGAIARGVAVHLITRSEDNTHKDAGKRRAALDQVAKLGVHVHELPWLHAKMYCNESDCIVTSFNLISNGRDSLNVAVHLPGSDAVASALQIVAQWIPGFVPTALAAFCIRCRATRREYDPLRPYCHECWHDRRPSSKHACESFCHRCGEPTATSLCAPLCTRCSSSNERPGDGNSTDGGQGSRPPRHPKADALRQRAG